MRKIGIWVAIVAGIVVVVGGLMWLVAGGAPGGSAASLSLPAGAGDWRRTSVATTTGAVAPTISLVEYSDFQCPACAAYQPLVNQLMREVPGLTLTYRHFPLAQHGNALVTARAAEAAGRQNPAAFWSLADWLFEHQAEWAERSPAETEKLLLRAAEELGLNPTQFKLDLADPVIAAKVERDRQSGLSSRVAGTPTFFLNGRAIVNPRSYDEFKNLSQNSAGA